MTGLLPVVFLVSAAVGYAPPDRHDEAPVDLTKLTLPDLDKRLDRARNLGLLCERHRRKDHLEALLLQVIRHGGLEAEAVLSRKLEQRRELLKAAEGELERLESEQQRDATQRQSNIVYRLEQNVELLTALRRVQQKSDPLEVKPLLAVDMKESSKIQTAMDLVDVVEAGPSVLSDQVSADRKSAVLELAKAKRRLDEIERDMAPAAWEDQNAVVQDLQQAEGELGSRLARLRIAEAVAPHAVKLNRRDAVKVRLGNLPTIFVALKSADIERVALWLTLGGGYRSGIAARWRFEVKDSHGTIRPALQPTPSIVASEMYEERLFEYGETLQIAMLPMSHYITISEPGDYSVTVIYPNSLTIADAEDPGDLEGLILFKSEPFKLTVKDR